MNRIKSLLFVPVAEKFLKKLATLQTDAVILDLEESILPESKQIALNLLISEIPNLEKTNSQKWFVRVNKENAVEEITKTNIANIDGFVLPKFDGKEDVKTIKNLIGNKDLMALIETPSGIINVDKIVQMSEITALAFGAEDYTASMNMENSYYNLLYAKNKLVTYAKAYQKAVYDTPCLNVKDNFVIENEIVQSLQMGFDGKLAVHPNQAIMINKKFNNHDYDYIQFVVNEYEKNDSAVLVLDGKVYERLHYQRLKRILNNRIY